MQAESVIKEILKHHDELSSEAVFAASVEERTGAYIVATGMRVLLERIRDNLCKSEKTTEAFDEAMVKHYKSFGKGLLYNEKNRSLKIDE